MVEHTTVMGMMRTLMMVTVSLGLTSAAPTLSASDIPRTMKAVRALGACSSPFRCVHVDTVSTPRAKPGGLLIKMNTSSVNPSDADTVEFGGCMAGCGADISGVVVECDGCKRLKPGDEVWGLSNPAYAQYVAAESEDDFAIRPSNLDAISAGTIPEVGLTSLFSLKRTGSEPGTPLPTGSPWTKDNLTIVITAGSGGTGFIGIELAKAYGATNIATSTSGEEAIAFVKKLGATIVTDYMKQDIFSALQDNSVDIVYDNYGAEGTADKAMRTIRPGGIYLLMPHGECFEKKTQGPPCLSAHPKAGVRQLNYDTSKDFAANALQALTELSTLFEQDKLHAYVEKVFTIDDAPLAFNYSAGPGSGGVGNHIGKIAMTMA